MNSYGILRLTKDVEHRNNVYRIGLAENIYNGSTKENEAHFWNAVAFGKTGERIFNNCKKGDRIMIKNGRMQNNNYTNRDGEQVYSTQLVIFDFEYVEKRNQPSTFSSNEAQQVYNDVKREYASIDVNEDDLPF